MAEWKKICCAIDLSDSSGIVVEKAASLAGRLQGELTLLHVYEAHAASAEILLERFEHVTLERHDAPVCIGRDVAEAVAFALALGPAGEIMRLAGEHGERLRADVVGALEGALEPYAGHLGVVMPSSAWFVSAVRAPVRKAERAR